MKKLNPQLIDNFVSVPYRVLFFKNLSLSDCIVYSYLNDFSRNISEIIWESTRNMANKLNLSPASITQCISHLESVGLIQVYRKHGKPNVYKILHDLRDPEDTFGLENNDSSQNDPDFDALPNYVKDAILEWENN